jgi:hypothetical protein
LKGKSRSNERWQKRLVARLATSMNNLTETCPNRQAERIPSLLRADLDAIAERYEAADRRAKLAATIPDREAAEDERRGAAADFWLAETDLADLLLMLLRLTLRHQPDALRHYLAEALRPEIEPLANAFARMEARR